MTASSRPLWLVLAGLAAGPTPACLHVQGTVRTTETVAPAAPPADQFATLRPGDVIPTNPSAKAAPAAIQPTVPIEKPAPAPVQTVSRHKAPLPDPDPPAPPGDGVTAVKAAEPGPLPPLAAPPVAEPPLLAAMRAYVEHRPDDAIRHLRALDQPNQEFALAVMPLLARGAQMNLAAPDPADAAVLAEQLGSAAARLEGKAALRVDKVSFCRRATGFGRYDPWPEAQPYRPNDLAVLYVELRHVGSEPAAGPGGEGFVSRAVVSLEVRDAGGRLVEQTDPADWRRRVPVARFEHTDHTRSPLRDYSRTYRISVPSQPGVYTVTVEVKDPAGNRTARSQPAEFRVAGP